jgi:autotransporter adhesin
LTAAGLKVDTAGVAQNAFVAYDSTAKTGVTLGNGTVGAQIHQVVAGVGDTDATNVAQLKALGATIGTSGTVTNSFVSYTGTTKDLVSLLGTAGTKISNVSAGALNATSMDAVNGSQLYNVGSTTAAALGGGATMGTDGKIKAPAYTVAGSTYADVGNALTAVAGLAQAGAADAVMYNSSTHDKVTLGGTGSTKPVTVSNVADGVANNDAVNVEQLNSAISTATSGSQVLTQSLKYVRFGASSAATAQASGSDSIAIGGNAFANASGALAFGLNSRATGANSVAIGVGSRADQDNTVSVGSQFTQRRITNVANGTDQSDAVNLGQVEDLLTAATATKSVQTVKSTRQLLGANADGTPATVFALTDVIGVGTTDKLDQVETSGTDSIAIGLNTKANADQAVAIGTNVSAASTGAVAIGNSVISSGVNATAIGVQASVIADRGLAVGYYADAETTDSIAIGTKASVGGAATSGIAIGLNSVVSGAGSVIVGNNSAVSGTNTVALGNNIIGAKAGTAAVGNNSVILGNGSDGSQSNVVSVGAKGTERKIVNVAAGTTTTDAVNLGQMTTAIAAAGTGGGGSTLITQAAAGSDLLVGGATDGTHVNFANNGAVARELIGVAAGTTDTSAVNLNQLKPVVAALGGGAAIDATTGKVTGPTYTIQGSTYNNAGSAFEKVDGSLTTMKSDIAAITADSGGLGLVAQDASTRNITVGGSTDGDVVDVTGTAGTRKITGVTAGDLTSTSVDAINGTQLYSAASGLATAIGGGAALNSDGTITQPSFSVGGKPVHNVADAISNIDGRVTSNTESLTTLQTTVNNITSSGGVATPNAVAYDSSAHDTLTLASTAGGTTKLSGLTAGDISSATSTDAVNGGQLYATNQDVAALQASVTNIASTGSTSIGINGADGVAGTAGAAGATGADAIAMGDNASASGDHAVVIGGGATGTGDGTIAIGGNAGASGKDSIAIGNGATAPNANSVALGAGSTTDRDNSVSVGSADQQRQITNVAAGTQGTDAVNLNQMNSAVGGIARKAYSGIAAATALTMIPDVDANKTLSIGIGGGTFQGYAATAIGGTARITQNIKVRVGAGWSAAGTTVGAGASYQW